jgi:hypothetical protein
MTATTAICRGRGPVSAREGQERARGGTHAGRGSDRTRAKLGKQFALVVVRNGGDDVYEAGDAAEAMLLADFGAELVEGDGRAGVVGGDELGRDPGRSAEEELGLGRA